MKIEGLELFAALVDHLDEDAEALASEVCEASKRDKTRRFRGEVRRNIFERDGGKCFYCGVLVGNRWHADHVIPWSKGGRTNEKNGVVACPSCNLKKSAKVW